ASLHDALPIFSDDLLQFFLGEQFIHKTYFLWYELVENQPARHSFNDFGFELTVFSPNIHPTLDPSVLRDLSFIQGDDNIFLSIESHSLSSHWLFWSGSLSFGNIIKP